jgi:hypothetical protein
MKCLLIHEPSPSSVPDTQYVVTPCGCPSLSLSLAPELLLLLLPDLLVDLRALAGLVTVHARRQRSILLAGLFLLGFVVVLALALLLACELVLDGALVLCGIISIIT